MRELIDDQAPDITLSIAAPASYWYLKAFPIKKMAPLLDYIVFMTYDLHGRITYAPLLPWRSSRREQVSGTPETNGQHQVALTATVSGHMSITPKHRTLWP